MRCVLCDTSLSNHAIIDGDKAFCCHGCQTVYSILSTKGSLSNYRENPLFLQAVRSGLISNPDLLEQIRSSREEVAREELKRLHFEVGDLWCPSCAEVIKLVLLQARGVQNCVVDYATDIASIEYSPRYLSKDEIFEAVRALGYRPMALDASERRSVSFDLYLRFGIAAFCSSNIMMFSYPIYASYFQAEESGYISLLTWLSFFMSLPVLTYSAWPIFRRFFSTLQVGLFGMEALVAIGVTAAFGLSTYELIRGSSHVYFDTMAVIVTLVLLGKIIESKAKFSAKESLFRLSRSLPRRGRKRFADGRQEFVSVKEIAVGDLVVVCAGEKVVLDGEIVEGIGACDESLMTGEVMPISKKVGSSLLGGSILKQGWLTYRVTNSADESAMQKIIKIVEQEIGHKSAYVRSADLIVRWFVPLVLVLAAGTVAFHCLFVEADPGKTVLASAVTHALAVLLISCPCAIGIAAPLAESHLLHRLVDLGAIVRNRAALGLLGKVTTYVFDKTGTVTEGKFRLLNGLKNLSGPDRSALKAVASQSTHPVACAVAEALNEAPKAIQKVEEVIGRGMRGEVDGREILLGSAIFLQQQGVTALEEGERGVLTQAVESYAYVAIDKRFVARLTLGDRLKDDAPEVVRALAPAKTVLLSGDEKLAVERVAASCGFSDFRAGSTPLQKRDFIDELRQKGEIVCMLGDGINDAPALAGSNIGISVISATDMSIQVSDVLLTTDRLSVLLSLRQLGCFGQKIIRQNLFWAFIYNVVGIGLAVFGALSPVFSAIAMAASSLIVLLNAQRISKR